MVGTPQNYIKLEEKSDEFPISLSMFNDPASPRFPRVPLSRRSAAFAIDFCTAGLLSLFLGNLLVPTFILTWLILRVILVAKNRGQSLGRYALDIRVIDAKYGRTPGLLELFKREGIVGLGALLALLGIRYLSPANAWSILLMIPLPVDCVFAVVEGSRRQAFHDQIAGTLVVQTRRGYSLDLKIKKWVAKFKSNMK